MLIDLHVHTTRGASDSSLTPAELVKEAKRIGLDGVCVTEHSSVWQESAARTLAEESGLVILRGMEVNTDLGHLVAFGLESYIGGIHRAGELKRVVEAMGGFIVAVHPFRWFFSPMPLPVNGSYHRATTLEEALKMPLFEIANELEVLNGACLPLENDFAFQVAQRLGKRGTGGSDAHSTHGLGSCLTVF